MSHIWVPKVKILEAELAPVKPVGVKGFYTIKKYKSGFKEPVQVVGPFSNLITNWGFERIGPGTCDSNAIYVGSGTAPASVSDVRLGTFVARQTLDQGSNSIERDPTGVEHWAQTSFTKRFPAGQATGTLTEVGFGNEGALTPVHDYALFSRALIVDSGGSPVAITVLPDEYLDVTYTLRVYPPLADNTSIINISGTSHTIVSRGLNFPTSVAVALTSIRSRLGFAGQGAPVSIPTVCTGTAAGTPPALAAITASSMLNMGGQNSSGTITKTSLHPTVTCTSTWGLANGNLSYGIRGLFGMISTGGLTYYFQATVTPGIAKDATKILSFGFTYSYARH